MKGPNSGGDLAEGTAGSENASDAANDSSTAVSTANDSAETLIEKAVSALQKSDDKTCEKLLKSAEAKDPKAKKLWAAYSMLALMRGMPHEAILDARKELESYPDETQLYLMIATSQLQQKDNAAALQTLRQWIAIDSEDPKPQEMISELLLQNKQYPEAADAAAKALKLMDSDADGTKKLKLTLGTSLLKSGKKKEGEETLIALLGDVQDPGMVNDIVYEMADGNVQLPMDEEKQKWVLERLSTETQSWTLDVSFPILREKSSLLVAAWDTMGWILYREGKFSEAKSYVEAAWWNSPRPEISEHLNQVNAALGVKDTASHISDQSARTFPLGSAEGRNGVAEYRFLVSAGKVERAVPVDEKSLNNGEAILKKAALGKYFPAGANAKLMCVGMLNCHSGKCELIIEH